MTKPDALREIIKEKNRIISAMDAILISKGVNFDFANPKPEPQNLDKNPHYQKFMNFLSCGEDLAMRDEIEQQVHLIRSIAFELGQKAIIAATDKILALAKKDSEP